MSKRKPANNVEKPKKSTKVVDTMVDFLIIVGVSLTLYFGANLLGAPIWLSLGIVAIWGGFTGYKPQIVRIPFSFMYKREEDSK